MIIVLLGLTSLQNKSQNLHLQKNSLSFVPFPFYIHSRDSMSTDASVIALEVIVHAFPWLIGASQAGEPTMLKAFIHLPFSSWPSQSHPLSLTFWFLQSMCVLQLLCEKWVYQEAEKLHSSENCLHTLKVLSSAMRKTSPLYTEPSTTPGRQSTEVRLMVTTRWAVSS